ncbi:MAG: RDD family protein, partial [Nocardioides sp.]
MTDQAGVAPTGASRSGHPLPGRVAVSAGYASLGQDDLVTGEAVALELPPASIGVRLASGLLDVFVGFSLLIVFMVVFLWAAFTGSVRNLEAFVGIAVVGMSVMAFLVVPATIETLSRGKSLGKWAMGLRVVRDDGGPISFHHAFVRSLIGVVETYAMGGGPAFFAVVISKSGKRLGDQTAGTYVVRERVRLDLPNPRFMPPPLAEWARAADVAALPTGLAIAVRQFLGRAPSIEPATR